MLAKFAGNHCPTIFRANIANCVKLGLKGNFKDAFIANRKHKNKPVIDGDDFEESARRIAEREEVFAEIERREDS